jgi:hypothetical protein
MAEKEDRFMGNRARWALTGFVVLTASAAVALALSLSRIGDLQQDTADLRARLVRLRADLAAQPNAQRAPSIDWRSVMRRIERLERFADQSDSPDGPAFAQAPRAGAPKAADGAFRGADPRAAGAASPSGSPDVLQTEHFQSGLKDLLKSGVKQTLKERRAKWFERHDQRMRAEIAAFGKQQNLDAAKVDSMTMIVQDDRDQRREIRRQLRQNEIDVAAARQQVDALNTATKSRIVETVGEAGYEAYRQQRREQRQVWRSLRHF